MTTHHLFAPIRDLSDRYALALAAINRSEVQAALDWLDAVGERGDEPDATHAFTLLALIDDLDPRIDTPTARSRRVATRHR